eukprot:TRINITY_DN6585_c0_g1_i1.p3 TRINITY_DN6585_c0_g1~~TRINITY_DN6585_c0_g1_i1.p3  ORF type:complete len:60 (+),score=10.90 TRINITY_DN6585_c0_g1_i1:242-421(+)
MVRRSSRMRTVQREMLLAVKEKQTKYQKKFIHDELKLVVIERKAKNWKKELQKELIEEK